METIAPIALTRSKLPDAPPEAPPENPREGFAQVMARQKKFSRSNENPVGLQREGAGPKDPSNPKEKVKPESPDPATDPQVTAFLTPPSSNAVLPDPPSQPGEPLDLEEPTIFIINSAAPGVKPQDSLLPGTLGEPRGPVLLPELLAPPKEDFRIANETGPASAPAAVQPEGTLKENPLVSNPFENLILYPAPESLTIEQKVSPGITAIAMKSSQTTTENGPLFSPQGPAIPEIIPIVDGPDPSLSLILRESALKGPESDTAPLEIKPDSQVPPLDALSRTEKVTAPPILEGPPIAEAAPVESNSPAGKIAAMAAIPTTSKEIPSDKEGSSLAKAEGLPDPKKTSPNLTERAPETSFLPRASSEKVGPGIALHYDRETPAGSGGPEMNNPIRVQEETPPGVIGRFPDPPRIEGVPADRVVEAPPKASPEWIKEALSVYQQYSKGLLRNLQHGGERIQMTLDPPQLGSILLEINRDRNFVTAHLWTDNPHTKELLDFSQGQLQKTLELDGFKLDRFEVLVQPDLKSFQEERWFGGRQPVWENSRQEGGRASPEGLIPASPETATLRFSQGNQYVDTWV